MKSRLTRKTESEQKRRLIMTIGGLLIAGFVLFQAGLWTITNISGLIIGFNERKVGSEEKRNLQSIIPPPQIDSIPQGSDKDSLQITGHTSSSKGTVEVYLNDGLYKEVALSSTDFKLQVKGLKEGENKIEARFVDDTGKASAFSQSQTVNYSKEPPKLDITFPADGASFKRGDEVIEVTGTTDANNLVKVNDFTAIVDDKGNFSYNLHLSEGDNIITILAINNAGAKTEKKIKVTFSP